MSTLAIIVLSFFTGFAACLALMVFLPEPDEQALSPPNSARSF